MAERLRLAGPGEKGVPVMAIAARNAGIRRAGRAVGVLVAWDTAERQLGHELGQGQGVKAAVAEYRAFWRASERTAWRDLEVFRQAFPGEETPSRLAALLRDHIAQKAGGVAGALVLA